MRLSPLRRGLYAVALSATMTFVGAVPAPAQDDSQGTTASPPTASITEVGVGKRKINVRAGRRTVVKGTVLPRAAGRIAYLQIRKGDALVHDRPRPHRHAGPLHAARQAPATR